MNRPCRKGILLLFLIASIPALANAEQLFLKTTDTAVSDHLSDVPCVTLSDSAPTELVVERGESIIRVSDASGTGYSASSLGEAVDGYLRLKGVCVVRDVTVTGHVRISPEAIRFRIKTARGDILHKNVIKKDIEQIYAMGYFEKCDATFEENAVAFVVREYPVVMSIEVKGNEEIKEKDLLETIGLKKFDILNTRLLKTSTDRIKDSYRQRGYYNVEVTSDTRPTEGGIVLTFTIAENEQLYIEKISFDGNVNVPSGKLRDAMETKTRWPLGIFGHEGAYRDAALDTDLLRIEQYYGDNGYMQAKVGRPRVDIRKDDGIYITIPVSEGPLFTVGTVAVAGDLIVPEEELLEAIDIAPGDVMSRANIQKAMESVRAVYTDKGYAYVQIKPESTEEDQNRIGLTFRITQGKQVTIDAIQIRGNTKTRDKVIRRELEIEEGSIFSSSAIRYSKDSLGRLGYFSSASIDPVPRDDSTMSLLVDVEETTTGSFSFGFAYSSEDGPMATTSLSEINLFGRGLKLKGSIEYGPEKKNFSIDGEEPWLLDHNLSLGMRVYNLEKEYTYYTKKARGGNIRLGYPLWERFRHSIIYSYAHVYELEDIDPLYEPSLSEDEIKGGITSSITNSLYRNTTNDYFRPTRGSELSASIEYAGLGGDFHFTRATASAAQFFPVWSDKLALMLKMRWGTVNAARGDTIPEYERFELGGLNSVRGFKWGEMGPQDSLGNFIGGERMLVMNVELTFPLGPIPGLYGVVFHDEGNSYEKRIDLTNLKKSYGAGIRWVTPMGPLRLEYARVINPEEDESPSRWDFSIGTFF